MNVLRASPLPREGFNLENIESLWMRVNGKLEDVKAPKLLESGELGDVVVMRGYGNVKVANIPIARSYCGLSDIEWGYRGTGPIVLSRNILLHFTGDVDFTDKYQNEFCQKFVAFLRREQDSISKEGILKFIEAKRAIDKMKVVPACRCVCTCR